MTDRSATPCHHDFDLVAGRCTLCPAPIPLPRDGDRSWEVCPAEPTIPHAPRACGDPEHFILSLDAQIGVYRLPNGAGLPLPRFMTDGAAGADVCAAVTEPVVLAPLERALIPTGFILDIPEGYEVQVRPRSGFALKFGVTVLNAPGTVDSDFQNEVGVILINLGSEPVRIERGDRVAQFVVAAVASAAFTERAGTRRPTRRGGGFGSTGTNSTP